MRLVGIDIGGTSVKAAWLDGDDTATGRSQEYAAPTRETLQRAIASALPPGAQLATQIGLCVPGRLDAAKDRVVQSINVPGIENVSLADLVSEAIGKSVQPIVVSDAFAAAHDFWHGARLSGRLLAISLGTGVGASVLDGGEPLRVSGETPGHFGQIDVSLEPDHAGGTLESYVGANRLRAELGDGFPDAIARFDAKSPPILALARAIRIAHAIYRPDVIALLGFVGMQFASCRNALDASIRANLTPVAKSDWRLHFGSTPFHAAIGAARLAGLSPERQAAGA